ncbi:MAG: ROK family protein [Victivallales bacterium]
MTSGKVIGRTAVLAIDAGGTFFKSALVMSGGITVADSFQSTSVQSSGTKEDIIGAYEKIFTSSLKFASREGIDICGIGVSTPGPFDYTCGMSLMEHKFKSIKNIPLPDKFEKLGCFARRLPVIFQQDVHSFLLGEHWAGALKGIDNAAAITLGTGLGFGLMRDGAIVDNGKGGPCIPIFNLPYGNGILEDRISRRGLISQYCKYSWNAGSDIDVKEIARRAREDKDPHALKVFRDTGRIMADELSGIFKTHGVGNIVFGGQISMSYDLFGPQFRTRLAEMGLQINAARGENIAFSTLAGVAKKFFDMESTKTS